MNWFVSATDTKQKAFFSWTAIVISALPVLVIAPVYTLPHQAIEDDIVGSRFSCRNTFLNSSCSAYYSSQPFTPVNREVCHHSLACQGANTPLCLVQLVLTSLAAVATPLGWRHEERLGIPEYMQK